MKSFLSSLFIVALMVQGAAHSHGEDALPAPVETDSRRQEALRLTESRRFEEADRVYQSLLAKPPELADELYLCEVRFNAAMNLEAGRQLLEAIEHRRQLVETYPACPHVKAALYYMAQNYHALQMHLEAADSYSRFARLFPDDRRSKDALENAILFQIAIGQNRDARDNVALFEKLFAETEPGRAATISFSYGYVFVHDKAWNRLIDHYSRYLRRYANAGRMDELVVAHSLVADGYRQKRRPNHKMALEHYGKAVALFEENSDAVSDARRKGAMLEGVAKSRYHLAMETVRQVLETRFPRFSPKSGPPRLTPSVCRMPGCEDTDDPYRVWVKTDFSTWYQTITRAVDTAMASLQKVSDLHIPKWELKAIARSADLHHHVYTTIMSVEAPPSIRSDPELNTIMHQTLEQATEPWRQSALEAYRHCVSVSVRLRWFSEASRHCERQLNQIDSAAYPLVHEMRPSVRDIDALRYFPDLDLIPITEIHMEEDRP